MSYIIKHSKERDIRRGKKHGGVDTPPDQGINTTQTQPPPAPLRIVRETRSRTYTTTARRTIVLPPPSSSSSSSSDKAGPSQPVPETLYVKNGNVNTHFTPAHCTAFFTNPKINPLSGYAIKRYEKVFNSILLKCSTLMTEDEFRDAVNRAKLNKKEVEKVTGKYMPLQSVGKTLSEDECVSFLKDPVVDPLTNKKFTKGKNSIAKMQDFYEKCENILNEEKFNKTLDEYAKIFITKDRTGLGRCDNIFQNIDINDKDIVIVNNVFDKPFDNYNVPIKNSVASRVLKTCEKEYLMKFILIKDLMIYGTEKKSYAIVYKHSSVYRDETAAPGRFYIKMSNISYIVGIFIEYIMKFRHNIEYNKTLLNMIQSVVTDLLDVSSSNVEECIFKEGDSPKKIFIEPENQTNLQSLIFEIEALKEGLDIKLSDDSSSTRSSNRSKSLSVKEQLPVLPKKTRKEILDELQKTCREMRDIISLDDFKDLKKKKLQLIVAVGPKNKADGKRSCYYVKNIYNEIKGQFINNKRIKDPATSGPIEDEEIRDVILPKMKYIDINVKHPNHYKGENRVPNIQVVANLVTDNEPTSREFGRPFYLVGYIRKIGNYTMRQYEYMGYIPANIYINEADRNQSGMLHHTDIITGTTDISSAVLIAKLQDLASKGGLTDIYGVPRVHINKKMSYWSQIETRPGMTEAERKEKIKEANIRRALLMLNEFNV